MSGRLAGQVAWVSGAASGIGEAIAELFAQEGAKLALVDIQHKPGQEVAERLQAKEAEVVFIPTNVASEKEVEASMAQTVSHFSGLHIVVNCAGLAHVTPLHAYSESDWDYLMAVNLKAIFFSLKHAYTHLQANARSYMVNIASVSSFVAQASTPAYTASKHAVLGLSRSIALDYAAIGLRCNCIAPGITDTPLLRYHLSQADDPDAALAKRLQRVPMGTVLTPQDIAKAALYFACEDSAGITGTSLTIDGGYTTAAEWLTASPTRFMEDS